MGSSSRVSWVGSWVLLAALGGCNLFSNEGPIDGGEWTDDGNGWSIDARFGFDPDFPSFCNPLSPPGMQGCATGQKCTWIQVQETPTEIGKLGCVPDGLVPQGGGCLQGPVGETTGFDNCTAGNICIVDTCQDICGFDNSADAACAPGFECTRYSGLFANGEDDPAAGACKAACDPLTQQITGGGSCGPAEGCYVLTSSTSTIAVCAGAGAVGHNQPIAGQVFANSCLPGHRPRRPAQGATTFECGALCRPADVLQGQNLASEGGVDPFTCESKGASPPDSVTGGESCRYYWANEPFSELSPYSNTLGFCWKHAIWSYDSNGDMTPDAPFPRCPTLTTGDLVPPIGDPPHNDAQFFWCVQLPSTFAKAIAPVVRVPRAPAALDRIGVWR